MTKKEIDEQLFSRQLYVLGHEAMQKIAKSSVLIVGLGGLGVEVAKNVILTGVNSVFLYDKKEVTYSDLSSNFYANEKDVGRNRVDTVIQQLRKLNESVLISNYDGDLSEESLKKNKFSTIVFTDEHIPSLIKMNQLCRELDIKFIASESRGLSGAVFVDFGKDFEIVDKDGENLEISLITGITNEKNGVVTVDEDKRHGLYDGDLVVFEGIEGMTELNDLPPMPIKSTGLFNFTIGDTSKYSSYIKGGYVKQVKEVTKKSFSSLKDALANPNLLVSDFGKFTKPNELHVAFQALYQFSLEHKRYPVPYNESDATELINIAKKIGGEEINTNTIKLFSFTCTGNLNPIAAFLGGFVAQEVQKSITGKFSPLDNFFYFESFECLPSELPEEKDCKPQNSRYDGQISVFGSRFQKKVLDSKVFVVGAGALGCEFLKNFAMTGLCCGKDGKVTITDMDNIEKSNLSRQFLFRSKHVGKEKSKTAAKVITKMNENIKINALLEKVAPETENIFNDQFWESLDFVVNAVDNVQARLYVDSRCVYFRKPLLESGTLGTKANTQVVYPFLTETYGSSRDPPEKEIPICTLKNFPNAIEHTIQYARDLFEGLFNKAPSNVNSYLKNKNDFLKQLDEQGAAQKLATLQDIYEYLVVEKPKNFEDCVKWARLKFEEYFYNQISQLLFNFPLDLKTDQGTLFWSGSKKAPSPIIFDQNDETHIGFIIAAANLHAFNYGIEQKGNKFDYLKEISKIEIPKFKPKSGVKISASKEDEDKKDMYVDDDECKQLIEKLPDPKQYSDSELNVIEFEKDDDTNHHIDFITNCSNLRATNYKIPKADRHKTKGIAGKIIPAMITTTALITGLVGLEIYKVIQGKSKLEDYRNSFVNLGLPFITQSDPIKPDKGKYYDTEYSIWDRIEVDLGRDITMKEFMEYFESQLKMNITMISAGSTIIYTFYSKPDVVQKRMKMKLSEILEEVSEKKLPENQKYIIFEACVTDLNDDDLEIPSIRYKFRY